MITRQYVDDTVRLSNATAIRSLLPVNELMTLRDVGHG
jgi:hypothetical protein